MTSVRKQTIWTLSASIIMAVTQIVQMMVLARIVDVNQIGLLAITNIVIALLSVFQDMGISNFLIFKQKSNKHQHSALICVSVVIGIILTSIVYISAPYIALFYDEKNLTSLIRLASFNFIALGICSIFQAHLIKTFQQVTLANIDITARLISFATIITLLMTSPSPSVIYIIYGTIINSSVKLILLIKFKGHNFKISSRIDYKIIIPALRFGMFQVGSQIINQLRTQADQIILGKYLGMESLGIYSLAKDLIIKPIRFINPIISRIILPKLAKNQGDSQATININLKSTKIIGWVNCIIYSTLSILSYPIFLIIYGEKYISGSIIFSILCLFGAVRPLGGIFVAMSQSRGKSQIEFEWNVIAAIVMTTIIFLSATNNNLTLIAIVLSLTQLCLTLVSAYYFSYRLEIPLFKRFINQTKILYIILILAVISGYKISNYFI